MHRRPVLSKIVVSTLILLALLMLISDPARALIQQTATSKEKAGVLISILRRANNTVTMLFHWYEANNIQVPQESLSEHDQAMDLAEEIENLYRAGNYLEASSKTIQALQRLKETLRILFQNSTLQQSEAERNLEKVSSLNSTINRYLDQLQNMESLLKTASTASLNATSLDTKIATVKSLLHNASSYLAQNNFEAVSTCITEADNSIKQLMTTLNDWTTELKAQRLEKYINQTETRLTAIRLQVTSVSITGSLTALQQAETSINLAKGYLEKQLYSQTITELISARESEEQAIQALKPYAAPSDSANTSSSSASISGPSAVQP